MAEKKKTYVEDIERTLYDIKNEDRSVYKSHSGLTPEIVKDISQRKEVIYRQASTFEVECSEELTSDIDGEVGPKLPLKIETVPQVLDIFY